MLNAGGRAAMHDTASQTAQTGRTGTEMTIPCPPGTASDTGPAAAITATAQAEARQETDALAEALTAAAQQTADAARTAAGSCARERRRRDRVVAQVS